MSHFLLPSLSLSLSLSLLSTISSFHPCVLTFSLLIKLSFSHSLLPSLPHHSISSFFLYFVLSLLFPCKPSFSCSLSLHLSSKLIFLLIVTLSFYVVPLLFSLTRNISPFSLTVYVSLPYLLSPFSPSLSLTPQRNSLALFFSETSNFSGSCNLGNPSATNERILKKK